MSRSDSGFGWFKTENYEGAWIPFDGNRALFRSLIQNCLRDRLKDPEGELRVTDQGPFWNGVTALEGLSYSQTERWGVVVFSKSHRIGVDIEKTDRVLNQESLRIAHRFFHPDEWKRLQKTDPSRVRDEFLALWMKKESFSKMRRDHLVKWISSEIAPLSRFETLPKRKTGYEAWVSMEMK